MRVWDAEPSQLPAWPGGLDENGRDLGSQAPARVGIGSSVWNSPFYVFLFIDHGVISFLEFTSTGEDYPTRLPYLTDLEMDIAATEPAFTP